MTQGSDLVGRLLPWLGTCHCGNGSRAAQDARAREGGHFIHLGSSNCAKFWVRHSKLATPVHYEKVITTPYKKLTCGAHCTCSARALSLHLYSFFQGFWPNFWSHRVQIWWVVCHHGWARAIVLLGPEQCKVHLPYGGGALNSFVGESRWGAYTPSWSAWGAGVGTVGSISRLSSD